LNRIQFQNYNQERDRQQQTLFGAGNLFQQSLLPAQNRLELGQQVEARNNQAYNRRLQLLQTLLGGPVGQSQTTPGPSNLANLAGLGLVGGGLLLGGPAGAIAGRQASGFLG
jgi:hypothetical protein